MRKKKTSILFVGFVLMMLLGIGYALTNTAFSITGSATVNASDSDFNVSFWGYPTKTGIVSAVTGTGTTGTITVSTNSTAGGTAVFTVRNNSSGLNALVPASPTITCTGNCDKYLNVSAVWNKTTIAPGSTATLTVNVARKKVPVSEINDITFTVGFEATPAETA